MTVKDSVGETGPRRDGHRWQGRRLLRRGGEWRVEAVVHQRDLTLGRPLYLTSWNTITPVCAYVITQALCLHPSRQFHPHPDVCVSVCYRVLCVLLSPSAWIPLKSSPFPTAHTFSLWATQAYLCLVTLSNLSVSSLSTLFPSFLSFPCFLSCLFFPWQLSFIYTVLCYPPTTFPPTYCLLLSLLPLLCTLLPLPFRFAEFFSLTLLCFSHRNREEVWVDSCSSHLCSLIGQRWSGAAGEWANHSVHPPASWQWPEGKWSRPCLEIWCTLGYVLTQKHKSFSDFKQLVLLHTLYYQSIGTPALTCTWTLIASQS